MRQALSNWGVVVSSTLNHEHLDSMHLYVYAHEYVYVYAHEYVHVYACV